MQNNSRLGTHMTILSESAMQATTQILRQKQLPFVLCGDMARAKHTCSNVVPRKVEIIVFPPVGSIDELKQSIINEQPDHFSLKPPNDLSFHDTPLPLPSGKRKTIDIDITRSVTNDVPSSVRHVDGYPLVPFPYILLRKLEQWDKLRGSLLSSEVNRRNSIATEVIAMLKQFNDNPRLLPADTLFDPALQVASRDRVQNFFWEYPKLRYQWKRLGFKRLTLPPAAATSGQNTETHTTRTTSVLPSATAPPVVVEQLQSHARETAPPPPATKAPSSSTPTVPKERKRAKIGRMQMRNLAATAAVNVLQHLGLPCAIFGSMGCRFYGSIRLPNDVDILVLPPLDNIPDGEDLKASIVSNDPSHFFLKDAKDPEATYKVLYYGTEESVTSRNFKFMSKVDILTPGILNLPSLPSEQICWQKKGKITLPVVPFSVLLLQKLQGWDDHRNSTEERYLKKAPIDVKDIVNLLEMKKHIQPLEVLKPWSDRSLFSEEFEKLSRERVGYFCAQFPQYSNVWNRLGFSI